MAREEKPSKTQLEKDLNVAQTFLIADPARFKYAFCAANCQILVDACYQVEKPVTFYSLEHGLFDRVERVLSISSSYAAAYREFFAKTPEFSDNDANRNLFDSAFVQKGLNRELTGEDLAKILPGLQGLSVTAAALQDEADRQERKRILKDCTARLVDADGKPKISLSRDNLSPQAAYKREVERLESLDLNALRAIKQKREDVRRLRETPVEELRAQVKADYAHQHPQYSQHLPLATDYSPPYKPDVHIPWSAELLKRLPSLEQRRLLRLYGSEQLTAAINAANRR